MKKTNFFSGFFLGLCLVFVITMATPALANDELTNNQLANNEKDVSDAFAQWRTALSSGDPEKIVRLYDDKAVLLATLQATPITNQQDRLTYFKGLLARPELSATVTKQFINVLDENTAVVSGLYTFEFQDGDKTVKIPARYSFVFEKGAKGWLIVEHHSSKAP
jgi:uncharacterized protein (TIGR02246 family)